MTGGETGDGGGGRRKGGKGEREDRGKGGNGEEKKGGKEEGKEGGKIVVEALSGRAVSVAWGAPPPLLKESPASMC